MYEKEKFRESGSPGDIQESVTVTSGFMENDNPVGIRAGCHIVHSPDIGGFGEYLLVDQHSVARESCSDAERNDMFFQPNRLFPHLPHFKRYPAPGTGDPVELPKYRSHNPGPFIQSPGHGNLLSDIFLVNSVKPAAEPVVFTVLDDIKERG
jgi:hypothetical protein